MKGRPFPVLLITVGALIGLLFLAGVVFAFVGEGSDTSAKPRPTVSVGQPVRDQSLEFTVRSVHCGQTRLGQGPAASGQFCVVGLGVRNVGGQREMFSDQNQKALSTKGTEYLDDPGAGLLARPDNPLTGPIDPGGHIDATLVYDVPKNVQINRLQLHDSSFTDGVEVRI